jgi:uncharacterized alkaline shock family protein YloU
MTEVSTGPAERPAKYENGAVPAFTGQVPQFDLGKGVGPVKPMARSQDHGKPTRPDPTPVEPTFERIGPAADHPFGPDQEQTDPPRATDLSLRRGTTSIADEVVEKVVGVATKSVAGIYDLGGDLSRLFAVGKEHAGSAADSGRGVSIRLDGLDAQISITVVIEFGHVIDTVTEKVRAAVIETVERMLSVDVTTVDILVDDVHVPDGIESSGRRSRPAGP